MKLFDCTVRLDGSPLNEVNKTEVTAAEIAVLRALHGADAVINIKASLDDKQKPKVVKRANIEERRRLHEIYASNQSLTAVDAKKKLEMMTGLFGHESMPLPDDVAEAQGEAEPAFAA